jgi:hypothetical protein
MSEETEAVAVEAEASVDSDTVAPVSEETATVSPTENPTEPEVTHETFGWDGWDGNADSLPENIRGWGTRLSGHYKNHYEGEFDKYRAETDRMRTIYEALVSGAEDPRHDELTGQLGALQAKFDELQTSSTTTQTEFEEYRQAVEKALDDEADRYAQWFETQHPHIFADKELATRFSQLLENGWELEHAPAALELSDTALAAAQKALNDGVPPSYALRIAQNSSPQSKRQSPRPGAKLVSGATGSSVAPNQVPRDALNEAQTLDDVRLIAAQRAMKRRR